MLEYIYPKAKQSKYVLITLLIGLDRKFFREICDKVISVDPAIRFAGMPPSTVSTTPVIQFASFEQRYATAPAISSALPILRNGNDDSRVILASSSSRYGSMIWVRIVDGAMQ